MKVVFLSLKRGVVYVIPFVDEYANLDMALEIAINAKVQRPSVCNSMETLLVHRAVAAEFYPRLDVALQEYGVRIHGDNAVAQYMGNTIPLTDEFFQYRI